MEKQRDKILAAMQRDPERVWFAKDFQNGEHFVGYEAGTRIGDLVRLGLVEQAGRFGKFMGYKVVLEPKVKASPMPRVFDSLAEVLKNEEYIAQIRIAFMAGCDNKWWTFQTIEQMADEYIYNLKKGISTK